MTQFADSENLSKNTLLEIDMADLTESHLDGTHQSCGLFTCYSLIYQARCYEMTVFIDWSTAGVCV